MSTNFESKKEQLIYAFKTHRLMTTADIEQLGMSREYLRRLVDIGTVQRVSHGIYTGPGVPLTADTTIAEASKMVPNGVICLMTALRLHNLTTQSPFEVWIAVPRDARKPVVDSISTRFIEMREPSFSSGIEHRMIDNVSVPTYSAAKTVADCFKFRSKIGLDVAIEALRDGLRQKSFSIDELWQCSKICRVTNIIRPYIEAMQ